MTSYGAGHPMGRNMAGGNMDRNFPQRQFDNFEQDFLMPPDIASIDSDINKISALTPFSDQYMPNAGNNMGQADQLVMSGYSPQN